MAAIIGTLSGKNNKLLMCGNPTKTSGVFFDSYNRDREDYKTHRVSCLNSPENIEMLKRKYGEGSDVYRVRVEGEFPRGESDTFISLEAAEFAKDEAIVIPKGDTLYIAQLTTRKWRMGSNGKIFLEKKSDMKKRGLSSPDRADAFVLAFANVEVKSRFDFGSL